MLASLNDSGIDLVLPKDCVVRLNITNKWKWCLKKRREAHEYNTKVKLRISFHFHFLTNGLKKIRAGAIVLKYWLFCRTVGHLLGGCCHHHIHAHVALQLPSLLKVLRHRCLCIEKMTKEKFYWTQGFCDLHHHWQDFFFISSTKSFKQGSLSGELATDPKSEDQPWTWEARERHVKVGSIRLSSHPYVLKSSIVHTFEGGS